MGASNNSTFFEPPTEDHNGTVLKREGQSHLCDVFTVLLTSMLWSGGRPALPVWPNPGVEGCWPLPFHVGVWH